MPSAEPFAPSLTLAGGTRLSKSLSHQEPFVVGSERAATFRVPHPSVGPRHLVLIWDGQTTRVESVGDSRGFHLNGRPPASAAALPTLKHGDVLHVGDFEFVYHQPVAPTHSKSLEELLRLPFRGRQVLEIPLADGITLGRGPQADVVLEDPLLQPVHAAIEQSDKGFMLVDKGGSALLANGHFFERHLLIIGDRLDFGELHTFTFDGHALRRVARDAGCSLSAEKLVVKTGRQCILQEAGFAARAGEFVGIIGPSGAGKTTLLRALAGLRHPASGTVRLNQISTMEIDHAESYFGYVPQQEIVHLELSGRQALRYAAALRLPSRTPKREIEKFIDHLAAQLGLAEHLDTPARRLSGGQLKRLSVAVELLGCPPLLLLDEPTSGLDPETETQLMRQLRELTATGCTVVCTTHLMENVHLMDSIEIVAASPQAGEAGTTVFRGKPSAARDMFGVSELADLYPLLRDRKPSEWKKAYEMRSGQSASSPQVRSSHVSPPPRGAEFLRRRAAIPTLLRRQWDIVWSDRKNALLLLGQPLLIGALIALAATGPKDCSATKLFLACTAVFWMACGNAAPELVRERAIFARERYAGLRPRSYLCAKFAWLWGVALMQAALLYALLFASGLHGAPAWQWAALAGTSLAATGIGLAISAWSRSVLQAVLLVPVITIPQILFSGYVFKLQDWTSQPAPRICSRFFPGFASQRLVDTSLLWHERILNYSDLDEAGLLTSYENLCTSLYPLPAWWNASAPHTFTLDEHALYLPPARGAPLQVRDLTWDLKNPPTFRLGATYAWAPPALQAIGALLAWAVSGFVTAWLLLARKKEE